MRPDRSMEVWREKAGRALSVSQHISQDSGLSSGTRGNRHGTEAETELQGQSADGQQQGTGTAPCPSIPHASRWQWAPLQALAGGPAPTHALPASVRVSAGPAFQSVLCRLVLAWKLFSSSNEIRMNIENTA